MTSAVLFETICKQFAVHISCCKLDESNIGGRGIFATHSIKKGHILLQVPFDLCIFDEITPENENDNEWKFWMTARLMRKVKNDEFWIEYQSLFPEYVPHPFLYSQYLRKQFHDLLIMDENIRNENKKESTSDIIFDRINDFDQCNTDFWKQFNVKLDGSSISNENNDQFNKRRYYQSLILSRCIGLPSNIVSLIPFIDMLNHRWPPNASVSINHELNMIELQSISEINENEEIFIEYEDEGIPNIVMFLKYGFNDNQQANESLHDLIFSNMDFIAKLPNIIPLLNKALIAFNSDGRRISLENMEVQMKELRDYLIHIGKEEDECRDESGIKQWKIFVDHKIQNICHIYQQLQTYVSDDKLLDAGIVSNNEKLDTEQLLSFAEYSQVKYFHLLQILEVLEHVLLIHDESEKK